MKGRTMEHTMKKLLIAALLILLAVVSCLFVADWASDPYTHTAVISELDKKAETVAILSAGATGAAVLASMPEQVNMAAGRVVIPGATLIKHVTYAVIFCSIILCSLLVLLTSKKLVKAQHEVQWADPMKQAM